MLQDLVGEIVRTPTAPPTAFTKPDLSALSTQPVGGAQRWHVSDWQWLELQHIHHISTCWQLTSNPHYYVRSLEMWPEPALLLHTAAIHSCTLQMHHMLTLRAEGCGVFVPVQERPRPPLNARAYLRLGMWEWTLNDALDPGTINSVMGLLRVSAGPTAPQQCCKVLEMVLPPAGGC